MADDISLRVTAQDEASATLDEIVAKGEAIDGKPIVIPVEVAGEAAAAELDTVDAAAATAAESTGALTAEMVDQVAAAEAAAAALEVLIEQEAAQAAAAATAAAATAAESAALNETAASGGLAAGLKGISSGLTEVASSFAPVAAVGAAAGLVIDKVAGSFTKLATEAKNFSVVSGASVEDASRLIKVSEDLGVSSDSVASAIGRMNKNIGSGKIDLADYGVTATDTDGQFVQIIQHLAGVQDASQRAAEGAAIFGKGWQVLAPIIAQAGTLKDRLDEVHGAEIITDAQAAEVRQFDDDMNVLKDDAKGLGIAFGELAVPFLDSIAKIIGPLANFVAALAVAREKLQAKDNSGKGNFGDAILGFLTETGPEAINKFIGGTERAFEGKNPFGIFTEGANNASKASGQAVGDIVKRWGQSFVVLSTGLVNVTGKTKEQIQALVDRDKTGEDVVATTTAEAAAMDKLGESIRGVNQSYEQGPRSAAAFTSVFTQQETSLLGVHEAAGNVQDSIGKLATDLSKGDAAFKKTGDHWTSLSKDGRTLTSNLDDLGKKIGTSLSDELVASGGNYDKVREKAAAYRQELHDQAKAAGASEDSIQGYIEALNLTPAQVETTIKLSKEEEARKAIEDFHVDISKLPPDVATKFTAAYDKGDFITARKVLEDSVTDNGKGVQSDVHVNVDSATGQLEAWRLDENGNVVKVPVDANTTAAAGTTGVWRTDESGKVTFIPMDANTAGADATYGTWVKDKTGKTVFIPVNVTIQSNLAQFLNSLPAFLRGGKTFDPNNPFGTGMTGIAGVPAGGGFYDVGEAGKERVFLPGGARLATAGETMQMDAAGGGAGGTVFNITINAHPTNNPAEIGGVVVTAIKAYERRSGKGWRAA